MTSLRFVPFLETKLLQGEAELYEQREHPFYQDPARAFAVPIIGSPADALEWRVYDRARFLALLRRLLRAQAIRQESVVGIFGLDQAAAQVIDPGQGGPARPAVVVDRNRIVGVWVEPTRPSQAEIAEVLSPAALGMTVALAGQAPRIARTSQLNYYVGRQARDVEPPVETLLEAAELSSQLEAAPPTLRERPRVADETIRRTPHLVVDDDPPLRPGTTFDAYVFTDKAAPRPFERSEDVIVAGPAGQNRFELTLGVVPSEHFVIRDRGVKRLTIDRGRPESRRVPFKLSVRKNLRNVSGAPSIAVVFFYGHRPAGKVTRYVNVAGIPLPIRGAQRQERPDAVAFQGLAKDPELLVLITRAAGDQPYVCFVSSTVLKKFKKPRRKTWGYRNGAEEDVRKRMDRFASGRFDKDVKKRIWALRGAGKALYKDAPENFRQALESLLAGNAKSHTILIATEEPVMPWEILVPPRATKPIGATQLVGRWPDPTLLPPRQDIRVIDSYVFAPTYSNPKRQLKHADDEAEYVCCNLYGERKLASADGLYEELEAHVPTLVHFICHGAASDQPWETIYLEPDEPFDSEMLLGMGLDDNLRRAEPAVFLNACEVGRPKPGLIGAHSFASSFIDLGARAVIAPLWKVKSGLACQIATEAYQTAIDYPDRPVAEILRDIRARSYDLPEHEDTYAAYCWYGDPEARLRVD